MEINAIAVTDQMNSLKDLNRDAVYPVLLALAGFILYWFIALSQGVRQYFYNRFPFDEATSFHIFFTKLTGFVSMGVLPALVCFIISPANTPAAYGLSFANGTAWFSFKWIIGLGTLLMILAFFSAGKPENLKNYPQVRAGIWTTRTIFLYILGWTLYLTGYEFLFRGVLLFPLVKAIGIGPAIAVNIAMYSATHIPKGLKETIGAIPLGLVLCMLTLASGTLWIAIFTHLVMALTNSFRALYLHPEMKVKISESL